MMYFNLGNYAQERIRAFTDTDRKTCTFQEYLKSQGLYASRFHVYLMSAPTGNRAERPQIGDSQDEAVAVSSYSDVIVKPVIFKSRLLRPLFL